MRKTIWKFPLPSNPQAWIELPGHVAKPLHVDFDGEGTPCLWAEVEPDNTYKRRVWIDLVGTGQTLLTDHGVYMNTFIRNGVVVHAYYYVS